MPATSFVNDCLMFFRFCQINVAAVITTVPFHSLAHMDGLGLLTSLSPMTGDRGIDGQISG